MGKLGMNMTAPNPRVGCVIAKNGRVIGQGYHRKFGQNHAEVEAIDSATEDTAGSTAYVTLEPCSHYGKTPPCVDRILKAGIKRVVIGTPDPNPVVCGIEVLKQKQVDVEVGVLENEAKELVKEYLKFTSKKEPYVVMKAAVSWDGKIASVSGASRWISNEKSREYTMMLRGENDSILAGVGTVNKDDPELTYRMKIPEAKQPLRIIIDKDLRINSGSRLVGENTLIFYSSGKSEEKRKSLEDKGVMTQKLDEESGFISPKNILKALYERKICSVLIEGGGTTAGYFIYSRAVDRVVIVYSPLIIGGKDAPTCCDGPGFPKLEESPRLSGIKRFESGSDIIMQGDIVYN